MSQKLFILTYQSYDEDYGPGARLVLGAFSTPEKLKEAIKLFMNRSEETLKPWLDEFYAKYQRIRANLPEKSKEDFLREVLEEDFDLDGFGVIQYSLDEVAAALFLAPSSGPEGWGISTRVDRV